MSDFHRDLQAFEANPFLLDKADREATAERIRAMPKSRRVMEAIEQGQIADGERRVLAIGHAEALADQELLKMPPRIWEKLPREREAYVRIAKAAARCHRALASLAGASAPMSAVRRETWSACFGDGLYHALCLERVIVDHDVLVLGETGTGKEAIAHAIQEGMPGGKDGSAAPRSALNAAAVPETLIESELFGHIKGAFTGATETRVGRIRSAKGGCFFLDEVGDLRETTQVKLLRVMETNEVSPLGADSGFVADVRYVAATHKDIYRMVAEGQFRSDFFQRIAGHVIVIPPLRDRREDIPALGETFVRKYLDEDQVPEVWSSVRRWLQKAATHDYAWPGNVRELQNALRSVMLGLNPQLDDTAPSVPRADLPSSFDECTATLRELDDWYLRKVLKKVDGNYAQASRILGIDRATIRRRAARLS